MERYKYQFSPPSEAGPSAHYQRYTVDRGLNAAQAVNFVVEGRDDAFIDPAHCYVKSVFRIVTESGSPIESGSDVFLQPNYGANLWSHVNVSLNNSQLPPTNDYPYTALLVELVGASPNVRDGIHTALSGWSNPTHDTSSTSDAVVVDIDSFYDYKAIGADSKEVVAYHRVHSDFLQTCAQLIPNRMQLGVTLTRGKDGFALGREGEGEKFRIEVLSVSLFVKRIVPAPQSLAALDASLASGGKLHFQRLHLIAFPCAANSQSWNWHNCFNNVLPRRVFVAVVTQESYFGSYQRISTYLESANIRSVRFGQDGREIMAEPYTCDFKYKAPGVVDWEKSDAQSAFAGLNRTIGVFSTPRQYVGMSYLNFVNGSTVFATDLEHSSSGAHESGSLDVHIDFATPTTQALMILVMGEYPKTIAFDANRNLL